MHNMAIESKEELETWQYLRASYYPRFVEGVTAIPWDQRFDVLKEIHGNWIDIGEDPIESMMEYIFEKGYFNVFCKGITVYEDGSFRLHPLISVNLGKLGIYDDCY